ncbi:MAG TPA: alpha/beta hydrolase [Anaerolineaceae bacterium]|nr:alpha/beta hydrolase [Anaerolineaceae bacterium]
MPRLMYGSIRANGVRINYYRTGDDKPPVVLLHGFSDAALSWNRLPVALEPEFDVVLVDARGHGYSAAPETGYAPEDHAADLLALIEQLQLDRPALVGHAMGAVVAATLAAAHPAMVRGLILEEPTWPQPGADEAGRAQHAAEWREQIRTQKELSLDELSDLCVASFPAWHSTEAFQWAKAKQLVKPLAAGFFEAPWPDWQGVLQQISAPGLLVAGEPALGSLVGPQVFEQAGRLWRRGEVVRVAGAGHNVHREQYREFLRLTQRFLRLLR